MIHNQLKELPSVSEVLLEISDNKYIHISYITKIIKSEINRFRADAKAGKLMLKRNEIIDATFDFPFPDSYAYATIAGIIIPDDIPAPILARSR